VGMVVSLWCLVLWQTSSGAWGHHLPSSTIWRGLGGGDNKAHASYMQMNYTIVLEISLQFHRYELHNHHLLCCG